MAAHTNRIDPITGRDVSATYPGFVNIRFEGGKAILTVRGDPDHVEATDVRSEYTKAAATVELTLDQHDWDQFVSEATRERGLVPGG